MDPLQGHFDGISSVAFSPDGQYVVSGSDDTTIRIWDAHTGQTVMGSPQGHSAAINSVAYSPDGKHVVSGSDDKTIKIWNAYTGQAGMNTLDIASLVDYNFVLISHRHVQ